MANNNREVEQLVLRRAFLEAASWPFRVGQRMGRTALELAADLTETPPDVPHIAERLRAEQPANEAKVGAGLVEVAQRLKSKAGQSQSGATHTALEWAGHKKISEAMLAAETDPDVPDHITRKVAEIAIQHGTEPARLAPDTLSEFDAYRATNIMELFTPGGR